MACRENRDSIRRVYLVAVFVDRARFHHLNNLHDVADRFCGEAPGELCHEVADYLIRDIRQAGILQNGKDVNVEM